MEPRSPGGYLPGSKEDFDRLYRECYPRLVRTLYAVLGDLAAAEDCVQEAFVKAFRSWPRFRPERPAEVWLHRIAVNTALSYRRRLKRREIGEVLRRLGRPAPAADPSASRRSELVDALSALPPKLSVAFLLRHYHGYSTAEIAVITGSAERTVRLRVEQASSRLRAALAEPWDEAMPNLGTPGVVLSCGESATDG
jgi:RNA polymerase sigma-70 factor, ECF subfamily